MFANIVKIAPGPLIVWLGSWFSLFNAVGLAHPDWLTIANNVALALAAVVSVVIFLFRRKSQTTLSKWAVFCLVVFLMLAAVCIRYYYLLETPRSRIQAEGYKNAWFLFYISMLVALSACISFSACALTRTKPSLSLIHI